MSFVVAIDGPAGSGKGTITKLVGAKEGLINIDTGAMYRCVTLNMLNEKIELEETEKIKELLQKIKIEFKTENEQDKVYLNGEDVTKQIREKAVNEKVSQVSHLIEVRENITNLSRQVAEAKAAEVHLVYEAMMKANPDEKLVQLKSLEALKEVADGKANKIFIPFEATNALSGLGAAAEMFKEDNKKAEK